MRRLAFVSLAAITISAASLASAADAVVRLRDGKELTGALLNREIALHAPYGSIRLSAELIARADFAPGSDSDVIVTTGGNRLSGFVTESIQIKPAASEPVTIKPFELESLRLGSLSLTNSARFLTLMNGDLLNGEFVLPALSVAGAAGASTIPRDAIESVWFSRNEQMVQVQLTDGKEVRALYPESSIRLRLESGGEVEISRTLLKTAYWRLGQIPPEVAGLVTASSGTNSAPAFPTPDRMVWIPPGTVLLGSPLDERGRNSDEDPRTRVTISRGFWMSKYEVTQGEYAAIMGENPSTFQGNTNRPVEKVSWQDANHYCARLTESAREGGRLPPGYVFRLPTEAEWEYACRAGTATRFSFGDDPDERELREYAWYAGNSGWTTHPVGQLKPNRWGLHDMHGNVLELCAGIWSQSYPGGAVTDYKGAPDGWLRVARGGSWLYGATLARSANRDDYGPGNRCSDLGFRIVLAPPL